MKRIIYVLYFICLTFVQRTQAQALLAFDTTFIFFPDSVAQNNIAAFQLRIVNYGSSATNSPIEILSGLETGGFLSNIITEMDSINLSAVLQPNDTLATTVITNYNANRFPLGIDVVVIWPKSINSITIDSLKYAVNIYNTNQITELLNDYGFKIFPNPFSNSITINTNNPLQRLNIYDTSGHLIFSKSKAETIDLTQLVNATYYFELNYKSGTRKRIKMIKETTAGKN